MEKVKKTRFVMYKPDHEDMVDGESYFAQIDGVKKLLYCSVHGEQENGISFFDSETDEQVDIWDIDFILKEVTIEFDEIPCYVLKGNA